MPRCRHAARVSVVLLFQAAACTTYDSSLLQPGPFEPTAVGGGGGGGSDNTVSAAASHGSSDSTSGGGTTGNTDGLGPTAATTEGPGGSGGSRSEGGAAGADGGPSTATVATGGASSSGGSNGGSGGCGAADCCPDDPDKIEPGQCGCQSPDTDTDTDGAADCVDECPEDPGKLEPGECGCGWRDEDTAAGAGCLSLKNGLTHRYSFAGEGAEIVDSQGDANAVVVGTTLDGNGTVTLATDEDPQFVSVPPALVSVLANATLEIWFVWEGGPLWTRLIDFGSTVEAVPGEPGTGDSFITMSPNGGPGPAYPYVAFNPPGDADLEVACSGTGELTTGILHHVALSLDTQGDVLTLYIDGMLACAKALPYELSVIDDVNSWLGRSQFASDLGFAGTIYEFRIYDVALTAPQAALSHQAGTDPSFL